MNDSNTTHPEIQRDGLQSNTTENGNIEQSPG